MYKTSKCKKVKDLETGIIYDTIVDYTNNLGKERKWAYRNKDKCLILWYTKKHIFW